MKSLIYLRKGFKALISLRSVEEFIALNQKIKRTLSGEAQKFSHYLDVPQTLSIEPTNYCNLACISCSSQIISRDKGYMDFDLFKKIIDDASNIGVSSVHLWLHGEPLLHLFIRRLNGHKKNH